MSKHSELNPRKTLDGYKKLISESGLFDAEFYSKAYSFPDGSGTDVLEHYLTLGWRQGFDPNLHFSTSYYLTANPDVARAGLNPLLHYLLFGKAEGRLPGPPFNLLRNDNLVPAAQAPSAADWTRLQRTWKSQEAPIIDVIVPVYKGYDETLRCLYSVLDAQVITPYRLIVVDDHSPDTELSKALQSLAAGKLIELIETPSNQGFVAACNLGMQLHEDRDVVLLNSDTEVFNDWLDRLHDAALTTERVATVTPLSNNAEICSYPTFCKDNRSALEIEDAELDALAAVVNAGAQVDIPTGVGFCMYVRRGCINEIGLFDFETFGLGYGEENDLCRRALHAGWRNIVSADVFVRHYGGTSFGASKLARINTAVQIVETRYPGYLAEVSEFIRSDPVKPFRQALDIGRLARRARPKAGILFVNHFRGGGTEQHMQEHAELLEQDGVATFFCRPSADGAPKIRVFASNKVDTPNLPELDLRDDPEHFVSLLRGIGITHIHVQHLADFDERIDQFLLIAAEQGGIKYDFSIHDYMPICPRINLVDWSGFYCGEPPLTVCDICLKKTGFLPSSTSAVEWRERFAKTLSRARRIFVPDDDVAQRLKRHLPHLKFEVRPHLDPTLSIPVKTIAKKPVASLARTIVIIGAVGPHKGVVLLLECARIALKRNANLKFVLEGFTDRDDKFEDLPNVTITGRYADDQLQDHLIDLQADIAWFPAVWPETYSYTLSAALAAGIFPLAFDFGAIASRLRAIGCGELMPLEMMLHPAQIVEHFSNIQLSERQVALKPVPPSYDNPLKSYYDF